MRRAQIQFKLLPPNYEFPVSKPKRQTYEWYQPKGILKRNWMLKHLHVLPAVVVLFQDIEWNDPQWSEKLLQCASIVQSLKNSLQVSVMNASSTTVVIPTKISISWLLFAGSKYKSCCGAATKRITDSFDRCYCR